MNKQVVFLVTVLIVSLFISPIASAHHSHASVWSAGNQGITLDGNTVVIHGNNGTEARIAPDGSLTLAGKSVAVNAAQQRQLLQYTTTVRDMEIKSEQLIAETGQFATGVVGEVFAELASGASEDDIARKAKTRANEFKKKALPICQDARTLKQLQDALTASLPAFKPYAVIEGHDVDGCEHDINSDDW